MYRQQVIRHVKALGLPKGSYIVIGGGVIAALNLREMRDIDVLTTEPIYDHLRLLGWPSVKWAGEKGLRYGKYEIGTILHGFTVDDLMGWSYEIDDVTFLAPELVYRIKQYLLRPNDICDIKLMKERINTFCPDCLQDATAIVARMYATL